MTFLPVIIIGSFASLFSGLPVNFWQNFIQSTGISTLLTALVGATTNMLGLYFTYGVASVFADKKEVHSKIAPILALIVYVTLLPPLSTQRHSGSFLHLHGHPGHDSGHPRRSANHLGL